MAYRMYLYAHLMLCCVFMGFSFIPNANFGSMKMLKKMHISASLTYDGYTSPNARTGILMLKKPKYSPSLSQVFGIRGLIRTYCGIKPILNLKNDQSDQTKTSFSSIPQTPVGESMLEVVEGSVPLWLRGSFFRNGPGMFNAGSQELDHLFDGYALLNKFEFRDDGKVSWRASFLETEAYNAAKNGAMKFHEFGTSAGKDLLSKAIGIARAFAGGITDNACVSIQKLDDGTMLAITESVLGTYEFDESSLATGKRLTWDGDYCGQLNTAHPLPDGLGGFYNVATELGLSSRYNVFHVAAGSRRRRLLASLPTAALAPSWLHSFALTERHVIVVEHPATYNVAALLGLGALARADHTVLDWRPDRPTRVHVVSRATGAVLASRDAPPLFFFHAANAFDAPGGAAVCVDLAAYADPAIVDGLSLAALRGGPPDLAESRLTRLTVPLAGAGAAEARALDDPAVTDRYCDFPTVHPGRAGRECRYVWAVGAARPTGHANAITKTDLAGGGRSARWAEPGGVVCEPLLVPRPGAAAEDDGVVLVTLEAAGGGGSQLAVLDAATLAPLCRLRLPSPLPYGFHGTFVSAQAAAA